MNPLLLAIVIFLGVSTLVAAVAFLLQGGSETKIEDRLAQLTTARSPSGTKDGLLKDTGVLTQPLDATQGMIAEFLARFRNLSLMFEQANVSTSPARFFGICGLVGAGGTFAGVVAGLHPGLAPVAGIMAATLPLLWLVMRRRRRFRAFARQLPDAMELIARALRAGHSLASGFQLVATEMAAPASVEFRKVFEEQNLGIPLDEALRTMSERMPNIDLRFFATAVILQRQTGGDLAEILDKIGRLIRERFRIWGQVQALTGEGRISGIVLLALPPAMFIATYKLNPDYIMKLFEDPMGKQMLAVAAVLQVLGAAVIKKIITIKV